MEVQAVTLLSKFDLFNLTSLTCCCQHMDDFEGIIAGGTSRILQNYVYTICREVVLVDWNPLRSCCIPRHKCNVIERCAVLAAAEISCQLGLNFFLCLKALLAFKAVWDSQLLNNNLMRNNIRFNIALYVDDGNRVASVLILCGADRVTLLRVKTRSGSLICNAVVAIDDQRADCHVMIFTIWLNCKGQITIFTNLVYWCIGIGFCGDTLNVLNNIASSSRRNCNFSILHELSLNHNISAQVFNGQRIGQRVSLLHGYPKCTHVVLGNLNIIYSPFCNHVIRTTNSRNSLKL